MRIGFGTVSAATAALALGAAGSATAGGPLLVSDQLQVFNGQGQFVDGAFEFELNESALTVYTLNEAVDVTRLGKPIVLVEPDGKWSDIVGICHPCGADNGTHLGFASDTETMPDPYGFPGAIFIAEHGNQKVFVTQYLSPALQAQGYTAWFASDGDVPEPAAWALMVLGLGMTGWAIRRRRTDELAA